MGVADKYLREGRTHARAIPHLLPQRRVLCHVVFGERRLLARQQGFRSRAVTAAGAGVDFDGSGHLARLVVNKRIIWELWGCPQPGRTPARQPAPPWRAAAPARTRPTSPPRSAHRRSAPRGDRGSAPFDRPEP